MKKNLNPAKPWKPKLIGKLAQGGTSQEYGTTLEINRPQHAMLVGLIVLTCAQIERQIIDMFAYIDNEASWDAAREFGSAHKFEKKIALFLQEVQKKWGTEKETSIKKILRRVSIMKAERDDIAHGSFHLRSDQPDGIVRRKGWGKEEQFFVYTSEILRALLSEMYAVQNEIYDLWEYMVANYQPKKYETGRWITTRPAD